jgi:hypothetical protein
MAISATNPTTLPAATIPAQRFDAWWLKQIIIQGPGPKQPVNATVTIQKYSSATGALSTAPNDTQTLSVADILNPTVQAQYSILPTAVDAIIAAAQQIGMSLGKL